MREPRYLQPTPPAPETTFARPGHPMKIGESEEGQKFLNIGLSISFFHLHRKKKKKVENFSLAENEPA